MRNTLIIFLIFFLISCKNRNIEIGKPENYTLTERNVSQDCNIYQMRFNDGKYIFKFSQSGTCKGLSVENYIKEYSRYLNSYQDSLINRRGYIIFDYYGISENNNVLQNAVVSITKKYFKTFVSLSEIDKNSFTLKVYDEKVGNASDSYK